MRYISLYAYGCRGIPLRSSARLTTFVDSVLRNVGVYMPYQPDIYRKETGLYVVRKGFDGMLWCETLNDTNRLSLKIETSHHFRACEVTETIEIFFEPHRVELR